MKHTSTAKDVQLKKYIPACNPVLTPASSSSTAASDGAVALAWREVEDGVRVPVLPRLLLWGEVGPAGNDLSEWCS